jgi:hypothetical protein
MAIGFASLNVSVGQLGVLNRPGVRLGSIASDRHVRDARPMSAMALWVQSVSATPLVVYRLAFRSPRSFADVD